MTDRIRQHASHGKRSIGLMLAILCAPAQAQQLSAHEQLTAAVNEFVSAFFSPQELAAREQHTDKALSRRVEIEISRIDPRLPLALCEQPLIASLNQNQRPQGRINVKVECVGTAPWSKYVPVMVKIFEPVLVTTRPIARGEVLSPADLSLEQSDISLLRGSYLQASELAVGMEVRRPLPAGATVAQEALAAPMLVKRGDTVTLSAKAGSVEIRQQGVALQGGELGKRINVRNTNSDMVVQAVVTGQGEASVGF
ncbi:MAG: flagellar basal body P-ring formation protein FlgA [Pseudomonadales bacterium]|nr:flagellar basal body P-ring formation protein FlgA [Pseudomonadales bacterium]MCP5331363.1 flagellar basal body P-ring formation protein FlgA [Pseudomonadales bacterium]MCP5344372.1 flagellar basal body P-ring formation protein FlgA [Pseudomonadales bacterium]